MGCVGKDSELLHGTGTSYRSIAGMPISLDSETPPFKIEIGWAAWDALTKHPEIRKFLVEVDGTRYGEGK